MGYQNEKKDTAKINCGLFALLDEEMVTEHAGEKMPYGGYVLESANFELDDFLFEHTGQYTIVINGSCNLKTRKGSYTSIAYYNGHEKEYSGELEDQTSAFCSIYSGLIEVLSHLRFSGQTVNVIASQLLPLNASQNPTLDPKKEEIHKICAENGFKLVMYRFEKDGSNTVRRLLGMPLKPEKK